MEDLLYGIDTLLYVRALENKDAEDGTKIKFRTEHSVEYNMDKDELKTDDGIKVVMSEGGHTMSITAYAYTNSDGSVPLWKLLRNYMLAKKKMEFWEVERNATTGQAHNARYFVGYFEKVSEPKPVSGAVEISLEVALEGHGVDGLAQLTEGQRAELGATHYEFEQIQAVGSEGA